MRITATVNLDNLMGIEERAKHPLHFYQAAGPYMVDSIMKTFEEQGRPTKWKPLAEATLLGGAGYGHQRFTKKGSTTKGFERHLQGKQILITTGMLRNSIHDEATSEHSIVGTNMPQAALLNFGGYAGRGRKVHVDARPFVVAQPEDHVQLTETLRRWVVLGQ
jgi:phage gpG-like protein